MAWEEGGWQERADRRIRGEREGVGGGGEM